MSETAPYVPANAVERRIARRKRAPSANERGYLESYGPSTYTMHIPSEIARRMEAQGWIEWRPPVFGCAWAITPAGRAALGKGEADELAGS